MLDASAAVKSLQSAGFTHAIWIPDSYVGPWESHLEASPMTLIRPCREGEAIGIAAGLMLGLARPVVIMQCTGLFEAGDALRNVVHDMELPLKMIVGIRSYQAHACGASRDNCAIFSEPIVQAWRIPYTLLPVPDNAGFEQATRELAESASARILMLGE